MSVRLITALGAISLSGLVVSIVFVCSVPVFAQNTTVYFHDNSELTFTYPSFQFSGFQISNIQAGPSSPSARVFEYATSSAPTGNGLAASMSATISVSNQTQAFAAFVAWVTDPFPVNVTLDGGVVMHVWMGSNDSLLPWQGSEFFMGIADYQPAGSTRFQLLDYYTSNATIGYNGFSSSPNEYAISTLRVHQHAFQAGSMLMFFVGAGSNKQGYRFTVYFDSPAWDSRADIPADPGLTVAEFPNPIPIAFAALLIPVIAIKCKHVSR